jgi:4-amino-4-deoxy-L-arabinose transferase-like glycosyltransferase
VRQGVYGSDLMGGVMGMDEHYLEFMPLMPVLQGVILQAVGVGVVQLRLLPALAGAATLLLTFALARALAPLRAALLAVLLLLAWQWTGGGDRFVLGSGVPLIDLSRIARYDVLVPPLGLGAWLVWRRGRPGADVLGGVLAGLAGLAHLYGLAWVAILFALIALQADPAPARWRRAARVAAGATAAWLPWLAFAAAHGAALRDQMRVHDDRLSFLQPSFYLGNVLSEVHRYRLGRFAFQALPALGVCLLAVGIPLALGRLAWLARRRRDARALELLVPALLLPLLFALFLRPKLFNYLLTVVPVFCIVVAAALEALLRSPRTAARIFAGTLLAAVSLQGAVAIARMQRMAARTEPPQRFYAELSRAVPAAARVLGPTELWVALSDRAYLSVAAVRLAAARPAEQGAEGALVKLDPEFVVLRPPQLDLARLPELARFMDAREARLLGELRDPEGRLVRVYRLAPR